MVQICIGTAFVKVFLQVVKMMDTSLLVDMNLKHFILIVSQINIQGGSNMTGTNCDLFTHK